MSPRYIVLVGHLGRAEPAQPEPGVERDERVREHRHHVLAGLDTRPAGRHRPSAGWSGAARGGSPSARRRPAWRSRRDRPERASPAGAAARTPGPASVSSPDDQSSESSFTGVYVSGVVDYPGLLADLAAEEADLDAVVDGIDDVQWATPTPAVGWDVRDSIAHLAASEDLAALALSDPDAFGTRLAAMLADLDATEDAMVEEGRARSGAEVLAWWRAERGRVLHGLRLRDAAERIPWITGRMSAVSFATACDGDLGARPGRGRRARCDARCRRRGSATSPTSGFAPVRSAMPSTGSRFRTTACSSSSTRPTVTRGRGASRPPTWCAATRSTSVSWSRSAAVPTTPRSR